MKTIKKIKRVQDFKNDGLGLFVHYGLYSLLEKGEWYQNMNNLTTSEYYKKIGDLSKIDLNLNIDSIINLAKHNGFKYIVLTSKHHDGFALYDSEKNSERDITETKTEDLVFVFIDKCIKAGIKPYLYYATWDWSKETIDSDFDSYLEYVYKNIIFLAKKYPQVSGFWFDGNWIKKENNWKLTELYGAIRKYNPEAMIINNSGLKNAGIEQHELVDSITFEQGHLKPFNFNDFSRDLAAEVSQTFNDHWGFGREDYNYKSLKEIIMKFLQIKKNKVNYLLNVSIDKTGNLIDLEKETINKFGIWLKKYGQGLIGEYEVVYYGEKDFIVKKEKDYYIYLYDIVSGGHVKSIKMGGQTLNSRNYKFKLSEKIKKSFYLDNDEIVKINQKDDYIELEPKSFDYGTNTLVRVIKMEV